MSLNTRLQQMSISSQRQSPQHQTTPRQVEAKPVLIVPGRGERTYINVAPVAVASKKQSGDVHLIRTYNDSAASRPPQLGSEASKIQSPNVPAIPRSQVVNRFLEPSYSTLLQLQNDLGAARQKKQLSQQPIKDNSVRSGSSLYANIGSNEYQYGVRSSDSQGSTTEEELLGLVHQGPNPDCRPAYYASPPSPVSSSYSELRQATHGVHPLGGYQYQHQRPASTSMAMMSNNYDSVYEPVIARGSQPPLLLSRQALMQHQQVLSNDFFGLCAKCGGKIVGEGSGCSAMGKLYHIHCFRCHNCQCLLQGKPFYALDGKPFCETDYINTLEKCCKCTNPILDRILRATGKPYHPQCFTCVACGQSLDGVPFTVDATNQIHCIEDFHRKFAPRCSVCAEPIMPEPGLEETVRVVALDRSFHVKCYKCEDCHLLLSSGGEGHGCYPLDDHVLCKQCNTKRIQVLTQKI